MRIIGLETVQSPEHGNVVWVRVHCDSGLVGLGETFRGANAVVAHIHSELAPRLIGRNPAQLDALSDLLLDTYVGFRSPGAEVRAASAIDIALWDILGKAHSCPIYEMLGGLSRTAIRTYNTCAGDAYNRSGERRIVTSADPQQGATSACDDQEAVARDAGGLAKSLLEQGIGAMKIWPFDEFARASGGNFIGPRELETGLEPLRRIRDAVGRHMDVMLEMHGMWSLPAAIRIAEAVKEFELVWIEDPVKMINPDAMARFARRCTIPICAGETLATMAAYLDLLQRDAVDYVMIDLSWCGGLTEGKKICALAQAHQRPVTPHDCTGPVSFVAGLHLALNARNAAFQESVRAYYGGWYRDVVTVLPQLTQGAFGPLEGPGLGTELRASFLSRPDLVRRMTGSSSN